MDGHQFNDLLRHLITSRRSALGLVLAASGAITGHELAGARKKKKHKNTTKPGLPPPAPPPPPLAFSIGTTKQVVRSATGFIIMFEHAFMHPASGVNGAGAISASVPTDATAEAVHAQIVAEVRAQVELGLAGLDVPEDRIAVTLL